MRKGARYAIFVVSQAIARKKPSVAAERSGRLSDEDRLDVGRSGSKHGTDLQTNTDEARRHVAHTILNVDANAPSNCRL